MQDQRTSGQSALQQQSGSSLQPNSSSLQQGGSPNVSSNVFTVLSQDAQSAGLKVQSAQTDPTLASQTYNPGVPVAAWLVPMVFIAAVIMAVTLWARISKSTVEELVPEAEPPVLPQKAPAKAKSSKKTTRRKRQTKR